MSPLLYLVFALLVIIAILVALLLWALDHMRSAWPYASAPTKRQRRAWEKERLPFARALNRSVRRG
ncbi:MAG TPA: hypothetical protein VM513_11530 [Kofleriaceae bacterium]|nr:hypothetical protein [Kofleriaceae bacterium]